MSNITNHKIILNRASIFVQTDGGFFWFMLIVRRKIIFSDDAVKCFVQHSALR